MGSFGVVLGWFGLAGWRDETRAELRACGPTPTRLTLPAPLSQGLFTTRILDLFALLCRRRLRRRSFRRLQNATLLLLLQLSRIAVVIAVTTVWTRHRAAHDHRQPRLPQHMLRRPLMLLLLLLEWG